MCRRELIRKGFKWLSAGRLDLSPSSTLIWCHLLLPSPPPPSSLCTNTLAFLIIMVWLGFPYDRCRYESTVRGHPIPLLVDNDLEKGGRQERGYLSHLCIDLMIKWGIIHAEVCVFKDFNTWHEGKEPPDVGCPQWRILTNPLMQTSEWIIPFTSWSLAKDFK